VEMRSVDNSANEMSSLLLTENDETTADEVSPTTQPDNNVDGKREDVLRHKGLYKLLC